jgi:hypothetical protein
VPYRDPDKQRHYKREWKRLHVAGGGTPGGTLIPLPFRLRTAQDILALLARHVEAVENTAEATPLEKARTVGYLAGIALKAVEVTDLGARLGKLEQAVAKRGQSLTVLPTANSSGPEPKVEEII